MANRLGMVLKLTDWSIFSKKTIDNPSRLCYIMVALNAAYCIIVHIGRASVVQIQTVPFGARLPISRT